MLVHNAKIKIQEEYTRKEKEREINKRMYVLGGRGSCGPSELDLVQSHKCADGCVSLFYVLQCSLGGDRRFAKKEDDCA